MGAASFVSSSSSGDGAGVDAGGGELKTFYKKNKKNEMDRARASVKDLLL